MPTQEITTEQVLLKTSMFGGFKKDEVLAYIDLLRQDNSNSVQKLEQSMGEMASARRSLETQIGSFEVKMTQLEQQLESRGGKISELTQQLDTLQEELDSKKQALSEGDREILRQKEHNRQLVLKAQAFEYKAQRYDEMSTQLGDMVISAQQSANDIVSRADRKAQEIKGDAIAATQQAAVEMDSLRGDIARIRQSIEEMVDTLNGRLDSIDDTIEKVQKQRLTIRRAEPKTDEPKIENESDDKSEDDDKQSHTPLFFRSAAKA